MMSAHGANPIFFNKKIKIERQEHHIPHPLPLITSHFCRISHLPPPKNGRRMCISPYGCNDIFMVIRNLSM